MRRSMILLVGVCVCLAGCGKPSDAPQKTREVATSNGVGETASSRTQAPSIAPGKFSVDSVPLSDATLGAFPEFDLPNGYKPLNKPQTRQFDRIPFWTGEAFFQLEGKTYAMSIQGQEESTYSAYELKKNMDAIFTQIGATKVFEGNVPREIAETLSKEQRDNLQEHYGAPYHGNVSETWIVRRKDKTLWINFDNGESSSTMIVVEEKPLVVSTKLLPADALRTSSDTTAAVRA